MLTTEEKKYQLALACIPNIGSVKAKLLLEKFGTPEDIFHASEKLLKTVDGIGAQHAKEIRAFKDFDLVEKELHYMEKYNIEAVFCLDSDFPKRLQNCYDPPVLLFRKGHTDLNKSKVISVVGTRSNSGYGKKVVEELIAYLKDMNVLVVSGLALGIDTLVHQACLDNGVATVGVLGQGLKDIYPYQNRSLAEKMLSQDGALISEFFHETKPDRFNFPLRNRIVAGMADVTLVVETAIKGGSMITANLASDYNRDIFAVPGKISDAKSEGCNYLIAHKKAELYFSPEDFVKAMNWIPTKKRKSVQRTLFLELNDTETMLVNLMNDLGQMPIDDLVAKANMSMGQVSSTLLSLELKGVVQSLPGKIYTLN